MTEQSDALAASMLGLLGRTTGLSKSAGQTAPAEVIITSLCDLLGRYEVMLSERMAYNDKLIKAMQPETMSPPRQVEYRPAEWHTGLIPNGPPKPMNGSERR